tara:strand:+ start:22 stop:186 length:165 start_codon:yes stop_codon:yes gene_type:complete
MPFIMTEPQGKLKRISVSVDENDYEELKKLSKAGLSIGFLIRESISDFLKKVKK